MSDSTPLLFAVMVESRTRTAELAPATTMPLALPTSVLLLTVKTIWLEAFESVTAVIALFRLPDSTLSVMEPLIVASKLAAANTPN